LKNGVFFIRFCEDIECPPGSDLLRLAV